MIFGLKANTQKLMINSFANGNLELVQKFYAEYGKGIFDHVPRGKRGAMHQKLIFYAFKNGHFNIINFYLEKVPEFTIKDQEIYMMTKSIAQDTNLINWLNNYNENIFLREKIDNDTLLNNIAVYLVQYYNINIIDDFINSYPDKLEFMIKNCSKTDKGKQLKRHLQLHNLIKD